MSVSRRRFYRDVSVEAAEGRCAILLDAKPVRTPGGARLAGLSRALADAIAEEWRAQGETIRPETMLLTKLANTAIDRAALNRVAAMDQVLALAKSDLVCYRASSPAGLIARQRAAWDPLLAWAEQHHAIKLTATTGVGFVDQPPASLEAAARAIAAHDDFALTGLSAAATLCGSAIIALALSAAYLDAKAAFDAAHVDEAYQAEKWGPDAEADARSRARAGELTEIARFLRLLAGG